MKFSIYWYNNIFSIYTCFCTFILGRFLLAEWSAVAELRSKQATASGKIMLYSPARNITQYRVKIYPPELLVYLSTMNCRRASRVSVLLWAALCRAVCPRLLVTCSSCFTRIRGTSASSRWLMTTADFNSAARWRKVDPSLSLQSRISATSEVRGRPNYRQ